MQMANNKKHVLEVTFYLVHFPRISLSPRFSIILLITESYY